MSASTEPAPLAPVEPAEPLLPWLGGKRHLARHIVARLEAIPHDCYAEPFCGMAGVFLRRGKLPRSVILNDIDGDVVNLFRVVREHPEELGRQFDLALAARDDFRRLCETAPDVLTDVQRAARFAYLQRLSFGGTPATRATQGNYAPTPYYAARLTGEGMRKRIAAVHRRLVGVHIERLDWQAFIRRYDRPWTLFYIDPPYWGHETDYGRGVFAREDFARIAETLRGLRGRFVMSLNDRPGVRETFLGFELEEVTTRYTASYRAARRAAAELLITGGGNGG